MKRVYLVIPFLLMAGIIFSQAIPKHHKEKIEIELTAIPPTPPVPPIPPPPPPLPTKELSVTIEVPEPAIHPAVPVPPVPPTYHGKVIAPKAPQAPAVPECEEDFK